MCGGEGNWGIGPADIPRILLGYLYKVLYYMNNLLIG
jgi:hypothetical protein